MPHLNDKKMKEINGIRIIDNKEVVEPVFKHFNLEYGDNSVIVKVLNLLNKISKEDLFEEAVNLVHYSQPFDFFTLQNLYGFIHDISWIEKIEKDSIIESDLTVYNNALVSFCNYILTKTRVYDDTIKYFLTYSDLIYYINLSSHGKKIIVDIYLNRGIDFFLSYKISDKQYKATEYPQYFEYAEFIHEALVFVQRLEEAEHVSNEITKRKEGIKEITEIFSANKPENTFEELRLHSERFWFEYLGEKVFTKLGKESKNELIDSIVTELLIEKKVLTNFSQVALAFCKVIERELNESLFQPYIRDYENSSIRTIEPNLPNKQRTKLENRLNTISIIKKCVKNNHQLTFGQIVFLMRFWDDQLINEYSNLFQLIRTRRTDYNKLSQSIRELLEYFELKDIGLTLTDIRNSSAHPTVDRNINWVDCVKWIKQMLGEPPKEILKRIVIDLR
jgi:hypothetical protein